MFIMFIFQSIYIYYKFFFKYFPKISKIPYATRRKYIVLYIKKRKKCSDNY